MKASLFAVLVLFAGSMIGAEPEVNDLAKDAEVVDSALIPVLQLPPAFEKILRGGAITITGRVVKRFAQEVRTGPTGRSYVMVDKFTLADGRTGSRGFLKKIIIEGMTGFAAGREFNGVIYPCGSNPNLYSVSPLCAYNAARSYLGERPFLPWPIVQADRKQWLGETPAK